MSLTDSVCVCVYTVCIFIYFIISFIYLFFHSNFLWRLHIVTALLSMLFQCYMTAQSWIIKCFHPGNRIKHLASHTGAKTDENMSQL